MVINDKLEFSHRMFVLAIVGEVHIEVIASFANGPNLL